MTRVELPLAVRLSKELFKLDELLVCNMPLFDYPCMIDLYKVVNEQKESLNCLRTYEFDRIKALYLSSAHQ